MKKIIVSLFILFATFQLSAQPKVDKIEFNKIKQDCLAMEYEFSMATVENAFLLRMDKIGFRGKEEKGLFNKDKGFRVYKSISISDISDTSYNYVVNIEKESKRNEDKSVLYLIIMKGDENAFSQLSTDELASAKKYLTDLIPDIEIANLELMISGQQEIVSKAEKKFKDLQDEKADMEKRLTKLQEDLRGNEKDQQNQLKEIENQKKALEDLKQKRKN